jgi:hypothetical protein
MMLLLMLRAARLLMVPVSFDGTLSCTFGNIRNVFSFLTTGTVCQVPNAQMGITSTLSVPDLAGIWDPAGKTRIDIASQYHQFINNHIIIPDHHFNQPLYFWNES